MKTSSKLPRFFCRLFGLLEILSLLGMVFFCILIWVLPSISNRAAFELDQISLMKESGGLVVRTDESKAESISIKHLQGSLSVKNLDEHNSLLTLTRSHLLPLVAASAGFFALVFDLFRRLFRNVGRGESFTSRNVGLVHWIGVTIVVFTLLSAVGQSWCRHAFIAYLGEHAVIEGTQIAFTQPGADSGSAVKSVPFEFHLNWEGMLAGLLILALGEVFRQGLALKTESELTI